MKSVIVNSTLALALLAGGIVTIGTLRAHAAAPQTSAVHAESSNDGENADSTSGQVQPTITLAQAQATAAASVPGATLLSSNLDDVDGTPIFTFEFNGPKGNQEAQVNGRTGLIVGVMPQTNAETAD